MRPCRWWWLVLWCVCVRSWATPQLQCQFDLNGSRETHVFQPVADPYRASSIDLGGRFRFKAVMLAAASQVESVDLYVSYQTRRQPMILQHVQFTQPVVDSQAKPDALTGRVALYSPFLGKELQYGCSLYAVTP